LLAYYTMRGFNNVFTEARHLSLPWCKWIEPTTSNLLLLLLLLSLAFTTHLRVLASSFLRLRDHTQWHTTVGRTPLDEWSARRRDLYLTNTQHLQLTNIHAPDGIRTRNPSRRAAADPRLRPLDHWDRHKLQSYFHKFHFNIILPSTHVFLPVSCLHFSPPKPRSYSSSPPLHVNSPFFIWSAH
jgi:hypothetical protein